MAEYGEQGGELSAVRKRGLGKECGIVMRLNRKMMSLLLTVCLCVCMLSGCGGKGASQEKLVVFNYGDYIDRDELDRFEKETGIKVAYEEFLTPEAMYSKYKNGTVKYDLICCSDYMIEKMIKEGQAEEIDYSKMENIGNIGEKYWKMSESFDPQRKYNVPYFWGTVGILYNTKMLDHVPDSWGELWNSAYSNNIIMQDSVRDSFVPALRLLGYDINTTDEAKLEEALTMLMQQKQLVQSYLVDEVRDDMVNEQAAMAVIYSGEASLATEYNDDRDLVVPKEGSNIWMDSWMIPKDAPHYDAAVRFLDFLCSKETAQANFDYVYYSTPNEAVLEDIPQEDREDDPAIFPSDEDLQECSVFHYLGEKMEEKYNYLWKRLKAYE